MITEMVVYILIYDKRGSKSANKLDLGFVGLADAEGCLEEVDPKGSTGGWDEGAQNGSTIVELAVLD